MSQSVDKINLYCVLLPENSVLFKDYNFCCANPRPLLVVSWLAVNRMSFQIYEGRSGERQGQRKDPS